MKFLIVVLSLVACACAADVDAVVKDYKFDSQPDGAFNYNYETSNGIAAQVAGHVEVLGKDEVALRVSGSNQYQSPEGENIQLSWVADENGYQPQGAHLPTPPPTEPIPEYIQRAVAYNLAHAKPE